MDLAEIARSMRVRMPWPVGQLILEEHSLPRGRGWDKTVEKLSSASIVQGLEELETSLRQHLLCGEKETTFYRVENGDTDVLRERLRNVTVLESAAAAKYPVLLTESELVEESKEQKLIAVEEMETGTAAVFSSVRTIVLRETLTQADFPDDASGVLDDFDEVVGIKHVRLQAIDVLWLPVEGNYIDFRVDFPQGTYATQAAFAAEQLAKTASALLGYTFSEPANLFSLMKRMYDEKTEGLVVELAFGTTTASLKHEKMRRAGSDLRVEVYHVAGKAALVAPIEPYRVSITWKRRATEKRFSKPELNLFSDSRVAASDNSSLSQAIIRKCSNADDYHFVRGRIVSYLESA